MLMFWKTTIDFVGKFSYIRRTLSSVIINKIFSVVCRNLSFIGLKNRNVNRLRLLFTRFPKNRSISPKSMLFVGQKNFAEKISLLSNYINFIFNSYRIIIETVCLRIWYEIAKKTAKKKPAPWTHPCLRCALLLFQLPNGIILDDRLKRNKTKK